MTVGQDRKPSIGIADGLLDGLMDGLVQLLGEMFPGALILLVVLGLCLVLFVLAWRLGKRAMRSEILVHQAGGKPSRPQLPPCVGRSRK